MNQSMNSIVEINGGNKGSTGKIMIGIADVARKSGFEVHMFSPAGRSQLKDVPYNTFIGSSLEHQLCLKLNYYLSTEGKFNYIATLKLLHDLKRINPQIIHLHNIHNSYLNLEMLFRYINKNNIKVVWTLHDCWAFTGHCPYFDIVHCQKWKTQCHDCPLYQKYPATYRDSSGSEYLRKKKLFNSVKDMTIVTPSRWLADLTGQSFLQKYTVKVIYNGIDFKVFHPRTSTFREMHRMQKKFIVLGVAFSWGIRKGLDRFQKLAEQLDARFQIVLVGIGQEHVNSDRIICIPQTDNQEQLAEIYTAADVFLNPTREDNFPTVNIEALACGTPVLSYGAGGSAEAIDETCGMVVSDDTVIEVLHNLYQKNYDSQACLDRSRTFDQQLKFMDYANLYHVLLDEGS